MGDKEEEGDDVVAGIGNWEFGIRGKQHHGA